MDGPKFQSGLFSVPPREYTRSVEIVDRTRQSRFKLPDFLYENDRIAHSVRIFDGTYKQIGT